MIEFSEIWLTELIRSTLVVSLSVVVAKFALHITRAKPSTKVVTWILALIPCWLLFSVAVEIPWFEPVTAGRITSIVQWDRLEPKSGILADSGIAIVSESHDASLLGQLAIGLFVIWLIGIVFLMVKYVLAYSRLSLVLGRIVNQEICGLPMNEKWHKEFEELKSELALGPDVELRINDALGPMLCLFQRKYYVIVPETFWESCPVEHRSAILLHELCHAKRADVWVTFVARMMLFPQWFNPFAWYALRQFCESVEMACDDEVLEHVKSGRFEYAKSLVSLVEFKQSDVSFALSAGGPSVRQRIQRIVYPKGIEMKFARMLTVVSLVLISTFGLIRPELVAQNAIRIPTSELNSAVVPAAATVPGPVGKAVDVNRQLLIMRTYYVGDLLIPASHNGQNGVLGGITERDFENLKQLIVENVSPKSWGPDGTGDVQVYVPNLSFIVSQTVAVHEEVQEMITSVRDLVAVTAKVNSFVVLVPGKSNLFPREIPGKGRAITNEMVQKIRAAEKSKSVKCIEMPSQEVYPGQSVAYNYLNDEIWAVKLMIAHVSIESESIQISLTVHSELPVVPVNSFYVKPSSVIGSEPAEIEMAPAAVGTFTYAPVQTSLGPALIEDDNYVALEITSLLKQNDQNQRAILILHGKIKDKRKQAKLKASKTRSSSEK